MSEPHTHPAAGGSPDDGPLLEELRDLIGEMGQLRVAALLEVSDRTLQRTLASGRLTMHMRDVLKLRRVSAAHERAQAHIQTLEERVATLTAELREVRGETAAPGEGVDETAEQPAPAAPPRAVPKRAAPKRAVPPPAPPPVKSAPQPVIGQRNPAARPWRPWPDVVTAEAEEGEELVYGEATPLIAEWRRARADRLHRSRSRVEQTTAWVRMRELELTLIGEHGLTLPPSTYPWDGLARRSRLRRSEESLRDARRTRRRALCWRFLRRVCTLGAWRR